MQKVWITWSHLLYFNFKSFIYGNFFGIHSIYIYSAWLRSTFLNVLKFLQVKEGGPNFLGDPILQKVWIIWSPFLYLNFKSFVDPNSLSFIIFQWLLHDSGVLFEESWNFYKLKVGDLIFRGDQFCRFWIIWSRLLYLNFQSFMDSNSSSCIRSKCILHDGGVFFLQSWSFCKLKSGHLISGGNQFCRKSELFGPPLFIWILKVL